MLVDEGSVMKPSRSCLSSFAAVLAALLCSVPGLGHPQEPAIVLVLGGDIEWSRITKTPSIAFDPDDQRPGDWRRVPHFFTSETKASLEENLGRELEPQDSHQLRAIHYGLEFDTPEEMARYPFRRIAEVLRNADIAFANLETPLSDRARHRGAFRTPTAFADGLRWAGIDVVATANNHALDADGQGLLDTREALWRAGVGSVGTGRDLEDARRPFVIESKGIRVALLGYAVAVNGGPEGFAGPDYPGVVPLDPAIIKEDIGRIRDQVDYVAVSFHWAIEDSQDTHLAARLFAHQVIDAGADLIIGHHPHVPRGVEIYKGKVIFYSLGNLVFGHNHTYWMDNTLGRLTLTAERIVKVEVLPIAGRGNDLSQPYVLTGDPANTLLEDVRARSLELDTFMEIRGEVGVIVPESAMMTPALATPSPSAIDAVFAEFDRPASVGCALGVAHGGKLIYKKGYGNANLDWNIPMSPTTVVYVGSISKQFTAAAIALLAAEEKLDLDDDVRKHLPEMPERQPAVTVRQLVHHTSGVPDMYKVMRANGLTTWDRFSREEALGLLAVQELDFPAGERYRYSNGGYFLLSMIVQRASGKTLREYAHEQLFEPLGMSDTHFHDDPTHVVERRALSYMPSAQGGYQQSYQGNFALPGAGGLYTTVEDLLRWDRNFLDNRLGDASFLEMIHTKGILNNGETLNYAFGIEESEHRGLPTLGHGGSFMGFKAYYVRFPDQRFSTWALCNMGEIVPQDLGLRVAELYLDGPMAEASETESQR